MKYLKIQNNGVLDIRLVALMGGTTKTGNEYKIGQFGTGLKYTLAYLVRNNIDFHIFAGENEIKIGIETEHIAGEAFNIICINGNRTSITDRMGLTWSAWMIIRELWCNALDEGGHAREIVNNVYPTGAPDTTCFYIQLTTEIQEVITRWDEYFVHDQQPIFNSTQSAIYPGGESLRIYKNGTLIKELKGKKALYSYDMKTAPINELREFTGAADHAVSHCLKMADSKTAANFMECVKEDHYEGDANMDYSWFNSFCESWKDAIGAAKLIHPEAVRTIKARGIEISTEEMIVVPEVVYKALTAQFDGVGALRVSQKINEFYESFSSEANEKIQQALVVLEEAEYNFSPELKFIYGVFGDKTINAQVNTDSKEVYISEQILDRSLFDVAAILIEENEHFKTGMDDCTRGFQTHFIRLYTKSILKSAAIHL